MGYPLAQLLLIFLPTGCARVGDRMGVSDGPARDAGNGARALCHSSASLPAPLTINTDVFLFFVGRVPTDEELDRCEMD